MQVYDKIIEEINTKRKEGRLTTTSKLIINTKALKQLEDEMGIIPGSKIISCWGLGVRRDESVSGFCVR